MIILQVVLGHEADDETVAHWTKRFGRFYSPATAQSEYPCTHDSHAYDVFNDEFEDTWVGYAGIIELPYPVEDFVPFSEESAGVTLAEWNDDKSAWVAFD